MAAGDVDGWIWKPSLATDAAGSSLERRRRSPRLAPSAQTREPSARRASAPAPTALAVSEENLRAEPNGSRLGKLRQGADLSVLGSRDQWMQVATRGYFWARSAKGSGASRTVAPATENLRLAPGSEIIGVLDRGTPLRVLGRAGGWLDVEIRGWIWEPSTLALKPARERVATPKVEAAADRGSDAPTPRAPADAPRRSLSRR